MANRERHLVTDSLIAGFTLGEMSKMTNVYFPKEIQAFIASFIPTQSRHPLAINRFLRGYTAAIKPTNDDAISRIPNVAVVPSTVDVVPATTASVVTKPMKAPIIQFPTVVVQPAVVQPVMIEPPVIHLSTTDKAWAKIKDFSHSPSQYPLALGLVSSIVLMSGLSLAVTLSAFAAFTGALVLTGAISASTILRNKLVDNAVLYNNSRIANHLPVTAVCAEGMKASKSWTLYFKSCAYPSNWKLAADFGAGMKIEANKKLGI